MHYRLRDNLHYCVAGGRTIFLDVEADRYFALPARIDTAFQRMMDGATAKADEQDDRAALGALLEQGVLHPVPYPQPPEPLLSLPSVRREMAPGLMVASTFAMCRRVAFAQLSAILFLRTGSLAGILRRMEARRVKMGDTGGERGETAYAEIAAGFAALDPVFQRADRCLVRSLAFLSMCLEHGLAPHLVFGVQTRPFAAHCWVQLDDIVLNDGAENVRPFVPILVI